MARSKYSGSKYMRAAQQFGEYQSSIYDAISHSDKGREGARAIEEGASRTQQWFSLAAEAINTFDKYKNIKETQGNVEEAVGKYEEMTGETVDYSKVSLGDILKGDAKLTDYGKESYKFGSDTYTEADMIGFGKKSQSTKYDKMLGIESEAAEVVNKGEASGWKYGETSEDIAKASAKESELKRANAPKTTIIEEDDSNYVTRGVKSEAKATMDISEEVAPSENWDKGQKSPNIGLPSEMHPNANYMGNKEGFDLGDLYGENSMFSKIGDLLKKPKKERLTKKAFEEVGVDAVLEEESEDIEMETASVDLEEVATISEEKPALYGDTMEKYLDKDWKFDENVNADDFTLGFAGKDDKTGTSSFNLYSKDKGTNYGKMFDVMKDDDSAMGYALGNKNKSFFGSQRVGEGDWQELFENESLQQILKGYRG